MRQYFFNFVLVCSAGLFFSCQKNGSPAPLRKISISGVSVERATRSLQVLVTVTLENSSDQPVSAAYATADGTAKAGKDYSAKSGTLTLPAGQTQGIIELTVAADSLRGADQEFYVQLSNPVNCSLDQSKATVVLINKNLLFLPVDTAGYASASSYPGLSLIWQDEFSGTALNGDNWDFDLGNNNGWGNNELEYYTNSTNNAFVSSGHLIIEARQERSGNFNYTSARLISKGKKEFQYGRIDIRAKLPKGKGIWPALWMLGKNISSVNWPACGEIDILEMLGQEPQKIYASTHWGLNTAGHKYYTTSFQSSAGSFDEKFHVYSLLWTVDQIRILVDDREFYRLDKAGFTDTYPFDKPFFFLLNVAVGGNWPGSPDATTPFPQRMFIDYIRVFQ
ncbi:MAG: family 16 glycosylhydrolase [Chitinophagaceae bacterium]